ncbi:MAG: hypothetical protein WCG75_04305 [Armatimonadota bacterium]
MKPNFKPYFLLSASLTTFVFASINQDTYSDIPAEFTAQNMADPVSSMMERIRTGSLKLTFEPKQGYLKSILKELDISLESQILVFSKTSLQSNFISPMTPRALYFNDHAYVGWIPNAPVIELIGIDPKVGPVFFTLSNQVVPIPKLVRQTMDCFQCHFSSMTGQIPGLMVRSVFAGPDGMPRFANGSFRTTSTSEIKNRWGGWYVTGQHGNQRHMGNEVARGDEQASVIDTKRGANVTDLGRYFDFKNYASPHSDIVALMVAEQQLTIQNQITKASFLTRRAVKEATDLLKFGFSSDHVNNQIKDRVQNACEPLVQALLCSGEPILTDPIKGSSGFSAYYSQSSPPDTIGRRLSELDLKTKLLKYSCSPMIYSTAFANIPIEAKSQVYHRFREVLSGKDQSKSFEHLTVDDKKNIREILAQTLPDWGHENQ